jgi:hypothetical protein
MRALRWIVEIDLHRPQRDGAVGGQRKRRAAEFDRVDAQQQVVHDGIADEGGLQDVGGGDAHLPNATSVASSLIAPRTASVISFSPPGFIIRYETRLIRSSPKRICGFMMPAAATTSPVARLHRWAAMVVEPTSIAMP